MRKNMNRKAENTSSKRAAKNSKAAGRASSRMINLERDFDEAYKQREEEESRIGELAVPVTVGYMEDKDEWVAACTVGVNAFLLKEAEDSEDGSFVLHVTVLDKDQIINILNKRPTKHKKYVEDNVASRVNFYVTSDSYHASESGSIEWLVKEYKGYPVAELYTALTGRRMKAA